MNILNSIKRQIPNTITLCNLTCGVLASIYAVKSEIASYDTFTEGSDPMYLGIAATLLDTEVDPDGIAFSLIGTTGIQFNVTDHLGLYLEPGFSWNIPSENRVLDTFMSEHPFMFSASSGIRFTL